MHRFFVIFGLIFVGGSVAAVDEPDDVRFSRDVLPVLSENCFFCHGPDEAQRQAELRLDTEAGAATALDRETLSDSALVRRILSTDPDEMMPPPDSNRSLSLVEKENLKRWVVGGATWGQHWSFEPLVAPAVPEPSFVDHPVRNPIDAFVQSRLAERSLRPSAAADRHTLLRRVTLDVTGLPPTMEDITTFNSDESPNAYEKLVDRLLKSEAYGERMAWNWLDAARYADSNGYQVDRERTMWPWRDWVVTAFNDNIPFDQFTTLQLAGDLLPDATSDQILATGFCRNHMINGEGGRIAEENRVDYGMDMAEPMSTVWLGLTLNCCRCHDHKYDPLTQQEYYQLFAFFNQTPVSGGGGDPQTAPVLAVPTAEQQSRQKEIQKQSEEVTVLLAVRAKTIQPRQAEWEKIRLASRRPGEKSSDADSDKLVADLKVDPERRTDKQNDRIRTAFLQQDVEYAELSKRRQMLATQLADINKSTPKVMVMADRDKWRTTYVLNRGLYNDVTEREVTALTPGSLPSMNSGGQRRNRLDLARWLLSDDHPLTARVTVNRFWQQLFGIGLVKTTEDFGVQAEYPVHKDLLDWLAADFRDSGWDVKRLIRTIVTSHTYRQSSVVRSSEVSGVDSDPLAPSEIDPENRLLSRFARYRMPSWMLRDQALAVSGLLNHGVGGPPINTYQPAGVWEEATFGKKKYQRDTGTKLYRRSLYIFWRRIIAPTMFFDNASRQSCTVKTSRTNTPLHALLTLNETTYVEAARTLAQHLLTNEKLDADTRRIEYAFLRILARRPTDAETQVIVAGLNRSRTEYRANGKAAVELLSIGESPRHEDLDPAEHAAWAAACLTLLNLDEALSRE
ncbi:MAG: PSD1 and planctomycete cytochrome C domain-containing protein [Fuerstiella sp.]|nr:PSD1 and planctomycete cytochrome C domain-containing protein [Fuerstiella sp.]